MLTNDNSAETLPKLEIDNKIATIILRKPGHANRLSVEDLSQISEHIDTLNQRDDVLVLRFIAQGKYFCSGFDLKALGGDDAPSSLAFDETVNKVEMARPVTIAVVQGGVYGGGSDLALACDFRIGTAKTNMFVPSSRLGLHFYPGGLRRYVHRLGVDKAKEVFLLAKHFKAQELFDMGYLTHMAEQETLLNEVHELSNHISKMAPFALLEVKKHLNLIDHGQYDSELIKKLVVQSEKSNDIKEGVLAWKEKREPNFKGD